MLQQLFICIVVHESALHLDEPCTIHIFSRTSVTIQDLQPLKQSRYDMFYLLNEHIYLLSECIFLPE